MKKPRIIPSARVVVAKNTLAHRKNRDPEITFKIHPAFTFFWDDFY